MKKLHIALLVKAYKINGTHYKAFIPEGIISGYLHEKSYEDYFEVNGKKYPDFRGAENGQSCYMFPISVEQLSQDYESTDRTYSEVINDAAIDYYDDAKENLFYGRKNYIENDIDIYRIDFRGYAVYKINPDLNYWDALEREIVYDLDEMIISDEELEAFEQLKAANKTKVKNKEASSNYKKIQFDSLSLGTQNLGKRICGASSNKILDILAASQISQNITAGFCVFETGKVYASEIVEGSTFLPIKEYLKNGKLGIDAPEFLRSFINDEGIYIVYIEASEDNEKYFISSIHKNQEDDESYVFNIKDSDGFDNKETNVFCLKCNNTSLAKLLKIRQKENNKTDSEIIEHFGLAEYNKMKSKRK